LRIAEQYVDAFRELAKKNNTMLLPADTQNVGSMVAQALGIYNMIGEKQVVDAAKAIQQRDQAKTESTVGDILQSTDSDI
jgi:hypothetical protein